MFKEYVKVNKINFIILLCVIIIFSLISLPFPYISKILIDDILLSENYRLVFPVLFVFISLIAVQSLIGRFNAVNTATFFQEFMNSLRMKVFCVAISSDRTTKDIKGQVEAMIMSDVELLNNLTQQILMTVFSNITILIGYMTILFLINWKLAIVSILFVPVYVLWIGRVGKKMKLYHAENKEVKENIYENIGNTFLNIMVINIYDFYQECVLLFSKLISKNSDLNKKILLYQNFVNLVTNLIIVVAQFIPLFIGAFFVKSGEITVGELVAFNSYASQFFSPLTSLINIIPAKKSMEVYDCRIKEYIHDNVKESDENKEIVNLKKTDAYLNLINYELFSNGEKILSIPKFTLKKGDVIHLRGDNGTGKSLFLKSICNIYKEYNGEIKIRDKLLTKQIPINNIANNIIYVNNEQNFIMDNLYKELTLNTNTTKEEVMKVLSILYLDTKFSSSSQGLEVSGKKVMNNFSTGELQRLRIARALLRKPDVIFLDEVFSNIDNVIASKIFNNIRKLYPDMAIIFVEHHMSDQVEVHKNLFIKDGICI